MDINYTPNCPACGTTNRFPDLKCKKCRAFLREKINNIDLWQTFRSILYDPKTTFIKIIYSEKKNYITIIPFFIILKLYLNFITVITFSDISDPNIIVSNLNLIYFAAYFIIILFTGSLLLKFLNKISGVKTGFRDTFSVVVYSYTPLLISLILISTLEYGILGSHWFTGNPSPFMFKPVATWALIVIEIILKLWSVYLLIYALLMLFPKRSKAFITSFILLFLFNLHYLLILV